MRFASSVHKCSFAPTTLLTVRAVRIRIKLGILKQLRVRHLVDPARAVLAKAVDCFAGRAGKGNLHADTPRARARCRGAKREPGLAEERRAITDARRSDEAGRGVRLNGEVSCDS